MRVDAGHLRDRRAQAVTPDKGAAYAAHAGELKQERPGDVSATRTVEPSK